MEAIAPIPLLKTPNYYPKPILDGLEPHPVVLQLELPNKEAICRLSIRGCIVTWLSAKCSVRMPKDVFEPEQLVYDSRCTKTADVWTKMGHVVGNR